MTVLLGGRPDLLQRLLTLTMAFAYAAMQRLRNQPGLGLFHLAPGGAQSDEAAAEEAALLRAPNLPLAIAVRLSAGLKEARAAGLLTDYQQMVLDQNVQTLVDQMGGCERIHRTPLPFAYVVHLRRALILYCYSLPFVLLPLFGWATIPVSLILSYILLGIEEIGVEISDPFGTDDNDLPLERLCTTIEADLRALRPACTPPAQ
jgi:putative membrane protein